MRCQVYRLNTGHEQLDSVGLIHMNGRVYDPYLGKMLSADPTVPGAFNSQAFNRYAYVFNNPLALVDPSGFTPGSPSVGQLVIGLAEIGFGGYGMFVTAPMALVGGVNIARGYFGYWGRGNIAAGGSIAVGLAQVAPFAAATLTTADGALNTYNYFNGDETETSALQVATAVLGMAGAAKQVSAILAGQLDEVGVLLSGMEAAISLSQAPGAMETLSRAVPEQSNSSGPRNRSGALPGSFGIGMGLMGLHGSGMQNTADLEWLAANNGYSESIDAEGVGVLCDEGAGDPCDGK